jgi:type II secretory pathway predicted ATPase ExeA
MYTEFYGFSEKPFNITPDPKFIFYTPSHREVLAAMIYGIKERKGFVALTGEVGTGKTTLIYTLLRYLGKKVKFVFVYHTITTFEQLLRNILVELDIPVGTGDKMTLLHKLNDYLIQRLSRNENVAVIIDEAQNLPAHVLEELRMLSNLETCKSKLIQIILVGQTELEEKLNRPDLRQLKQRIVLQGWIKPLSLKESRKYIAHRLKLVGASCAKILTPEALSMICKHAGGIPRTINIICDNALLSGFAESQKKIGGRIISEVLTDMGIFSEVPEDIQPSPLPVSFSVDSPSSSICGKIAFFVLLLICIGLLPFISLKFLMSHYVLKSDVQYQDELYALKSNGDNINQASDSQSSGSSRSFYVDEHGPAVSGSDILKPSIEPGLLPDDIMLYDEYNTVYSDTLQKHLPIREVIKVGKKSCIFTLARKYYHAANWTLADLILNANPDITDVNVIKINQHINIPEITDESFIIETSDNTYKILIGTFNRLLKASHYYADGTLIGKRIEIIPRKVSNLDCWYRVLLGDFDSKEESLEAIAILKQKGLLQL